MTSNDDFDMDKVLDDAEKETDQQFAGRISKLTRLSPEEVQQMCPTKEDRAAFDDLVNLVNSKVAPNEQKARLVKTAGKMGNVLLAIAKKVILPV